MSNPMGISTYYTDVNVVDPKSKSRHEHMTVLVENGEFTAIGKRSDFPSQLPGRVRDVAGRFVVPGLFNCHAHLALDGDTTPYTQKLPFLASQPEHLRVLGYLEQARINLSFGVTSVRDLHPGPTGSLEGFRFLRHATDNGAFSGSRVFLSNMPLVISGGHGTHWKSRVVSGVDDVVRAVRETIESGADCIKIMTAHAWGPLPGKPETWGTYFSEKELRAAVETAHGFGVPVAAHTHGARTLKIVIESGVDSVEHGSGLTQELADLMAERGTFLVPTLASYDTVADIGAEGGLDEGRIAEAAWVRDRQRKGFQTAIQSGVRIAAGSDAGFHMVPHGSSLHHELRLYQELGMTPMDALAAATCEAADLVGVSDQLGEISPGMKADFFICEEDPSFDLGALDAISHVVIGGVEHDAEGLRAPLINREVALRTGRRSHVPSDLQNSVK